MGLFGKGKTPKTKPAAPAMRCTHPVSHQITLHEDSSDPHKITGMKCTQCGERLAPAA